MWTITMASESLSVPEDDLREVIAIIRTGMHTYPGTSDRVFDALSQWCDEEEAYLDQR